jgi:RNA polymerase sigma factor (sigma-70 family)
VGARDLALSQARGRIAIGAASILVPGLAGRIWIGRDARRPAVKVLARAFGARDLALGLGVVIALDRGAPVRGWLEASALADLVDLAATLLAGSAIPEQARRSVAVVAAGSAAIAAGLARVLDEPSAGRLHPSEAGQHRGNFGLVRANEAADLVVTKRPQVQGIGVEPVWDGTPDETLLELARRRPAAFGAFYRRHEDRVLIYFLARVGDTEVAADLTAETFAAALSSAHRFRRREEPASAWLFGIARNVLAMSRRRGRVEARARRRLKMSPMVLTDEAVERIAALDRAALDLMDGLSSDQRDAVRARTNDEREYRDIAMDMRCSEAVVRKRVSRALGKLRAGLEER